MTARKTDRRPDGVWERKRDKWGVYYVATFNYGLDTLIIAPLVNVLTQKRDGWAVYHDEELVADRDSLLACEQFGIKYAAILAEEDEAEADRFAAVHQTPTPVMQPKRVPQRCAS